MIEIQIKKLRKSENLSQTAFAESLGLSRIYIATIEAGKNTPSDRTIRDICDLYKVNKSWLLEGTGEMHREMTKSEEITVFMADVLKEEDDSFKKRLINVLAELPEEKWSLLEEIANSLTQK